MNGALADGIFWLGVLTGLSLSALLYWGLWTIFKLWINPALDEHDRGHK